MQVWDDYFHMEHWNEALTDHMMPLFKTTFFKIIYKKFYIIIKNVAILPRFCESKKIEPSAKYLLKSHAFLIIVVKLLRLDIPKSLRLFFS